MAEAGILGPEDRVELIEGEIVDMAPIGSAHGGTTDFLSSLVARAFADGQVHVRVQGSLRLDRHNEPQPALMLLRPRADFYRSGHPTAADVLLLVEIADSSLAYDAAPSSPSSPPRRGRGVGRRSGEPGGRDLSRAGAGGLCRAPPADRRGRHAGAGAGACVEVTALLA